MTAGLGADQRTAVEKLVLRCRRLLEEDLAQILEGRFGIRQDGVVEAETELRLDSSGLEARRDLESVVSHLRAEGESAEAAVQRLIREAAFTHLNRLVAVRIAEAIGMLPETLSRGIDSPGFRDFREVAPLAGSDDWERFRLFLRLCADELAADVPALFDPRNPVLVLEPSLPILQDLVAAFSSVPEEVWEAPDTLGWVYQFFNTGDERRAMREASGAPRDSRELAVRNQFFTPRYVVDFLVHNGLGAHLAAAIPDLVEDLPYLVETPRERTEVDLAEVSVLDPACGSGHFLLGAYDVLERAWQRLGVPPEESAPAVISSLWGIDIDPRCTQIAQAAIIFRARRHRRNGPLPTPNVICARALPAGPETDAFVATLPNGLAAAVKTIATELEAAPVLGPLLKIEERLEAEIRGSVFGGGPVEGTLAEGMREDAFAAIEEQLLDALTKISHAATATAAERVFSAEATDAIRFVEAMRRRYTVVLMNPPFGEPVPETKPYLKAAYPWIPTKDYNLLAAFVGRGLELAEPGHGTCGAITSRAGMFLKTFEKWRTQVLLGHQLVALADLGYGVMEQALVEAAAYVLRQGPPDGVGTFLRLLKDTDRPTALPAACAAARNGTADERVFTVDLVDFKAIPGSPLAYWMSPTIRRLFTDYPSLEESVADVRQGLATGHDFRFVRAFWEVDPRRIARSCDETRAGKRWVPFAKGGEYSPYWADIHLVVDWKDDGEYLKSFDGSVIRNPQYFFRPGLTWPDRGTAFAPRVLPSGCVFSHVGPAVFPEQDPLLVLGVINARLSRFLADLMVSEVGRAHYYVGVIQRLPWLGVALDGDNAADAVREACRRLVSHWRARDRSLEPSSLFLGPASSARSSTGAMNSALDAIMAAERIDDLVESAVALSGLDRSFLDEEVRPRFLQMRDAGLTGQELTEVKVLSAMSLRDLIDRATSEFGETHFLAEKRHMADRQLEVLSLVAGRHPAVVAEALEKESTLGGVAETAEKHLSYLVGCAFGRWDIRIGKDPSLAPELPDLFDPVPVCPPGMLVGEDGFPAEVAPAGYPLELPPDRILLDEPGHAWDMEQRVRAAAAVLFEDADAAIEEMVSVLGKRTLRDYLRTRFFKDHLSRYSMSRRAAPIYWQLSVPSKKWSVWVYAPSLSRETLFAVAREAQRRERLSADLIRQLAAEREAGGAGRSVSEVVKELDAEEKLAEELRVFRQEAERVAQLGWVPDLDDGMVLNAAPLAELFPMWKKAADYRDELRAGKHEWATVARWSDQL